MWKKHSSDKSFLQVIALDEIGSYLRTKDQETVDKFNAEVDEWKKKATKDLKRTVRDLTQGTGSLSKSLKARTLFNRNYGKEAFGVSFKFERYGVWVEKGAGKGYGGTVGSRWLNESNRTVRTSIDSLGKMGTGNRPANPWANPTIEHHLPELQEIINRYCDDLVLNATRILIK